ncbi:YheC/YheD family protein [Paenibacillus sp. TRM 82003]|nr:YheC/YheD family protein [Paenibacillus sp. TRM 82003]
MPKLETIGILLDPHVLRRLRRKRPTGTERVEKYNTAARELGVQLLYTALPAIDLRKKRAKGLMFREGRWRPATISLPRVFHNRSMPFDDANQRKLTKLAGIADVFNRRTRYGKMNIHRLMSEDPVLRAYVPETVPYSATNLKRMMRTHEELFVKPNSGSIGKGIVSVARRPDGRWQLRDGKKRVVRAASQTRRFIKRGVVKDGDYLIQEGIRLAKYKGRPFDLRVSVQRGGDGAWQVTGTVGKVAARGSRITNLARGGRAIKPKKLYRAIGWEPDRTDGLVRSVSLTTAARLGEKLRGLGDVGFDIGLSKDGTPYVIEMNGRDQRYSFLKAGMKKTFDRTYRTPLAYAVHLLRKQVRASRKK